MNWGRHWFGAARRLALRRQLVALWLLVKDRRTPRAAKWVAALTVAYALSPIDLVPDFIPVLGQLDDLVLIPLGAWAVIRLTPPALWQDALLRADQVQGKLPRMAAGVLIVAAVWLVLFLAFAFWLAHLLAAA